MLRKIKYYINKDKKLFLYKVLFKIINKKVVRKLLSSKSWLTIEYYININKSLNLSNPKTFNEKLQWLKIYDRKSEYTRMVDKYEVRKYIAETIGEDCLIPLLGVYNAFDEIDFNNLPNQFVLKPSHTSGNVYICKDKSKIDYVKLKKDINAWLKRNYYWVHREWPYKNVKSRIICEKYMVDESGVELKDYKFFCFDGEPKALFVATDRGIDTRFDFFDLDFNHLPLMQHYKNSIKIIAKPTGFDEMVELSRKLSKGIPHVRVDFYDINGKVYFGELTFFHFSGMEKFEPSTYDEYFGEFIKLS